MKYMLDTNICIYIVKKNPPQVFKKFSTFTEDDLCISSITLAELEYGIRKSNHPTKNKLTWMLFLAEMKILPFDEAAATEYGEIRATLERHGTPIGANDLLIAAHARALGLTLVTNNIREFERIDGLQVENWI